jgi:hypothetical protein
MKDKGATEKGYREHPFYPIVAKAHKRNLMDRMRERALKRRIASGTLVDVNLALATIRSLFTIKHV